MVELEGTKDKRGEAFKATRKKRCSNWEASSAIVWKTEASKLTKTFLGRYRMSCLVESDAYYKAMIIKTVCH